VVVDWTVTEVSFGKHRSYEGHIDWCFFLLIFLHIRCAFRFGLLQLDMDLHLYMFVWTAMCFMI
jgi:hypothetical protein